MNLNNQVTALATSVVAAREVNRDPSVAMRREADALQIALTPEIERAAWLRALHIWERTERDAQAVAA
mgnify:CR=1 FL=1